MTKSTLILGAVAALIFSSSASAQADESEFNIRDSAKLDQGSGTGLGLPMPQILARSDVEGDTIKLTLSSGADGWDGLSSTGFAISVNAPFNKKKKLGNLLTEAGLPGTTSIDVALNFSLFPSIDDVSSDRPSEEELSWAKVEIRKACKKEAEKPDDCPGFEIRALAEKYGPVEARDIVKRYFDDVVSSGTRTDYLALNVIGSVGHEKLSFRDPVSLAESDQKKNSFSLGSSIGYVPRIDRPWGFFLGGEYKRYYELPDEETRCPVPGTGVTSVTCYTAAFGTPVRKTDAIAFGAIRYSGDVVGVPLGAELKVAYEPSENRWGVALPVYFIKNKDGKLNGGAKIGWQSDKDDFSFGFFIGAAFDFLNM